MKATNDHKVSELDENLISCQTQVAMTKFKEKSDATEIRKENGFIDVIFF